jgi:hypothetical protein
MTEKQQKTAFVRQLKPALNAAKLIQRNEKAKVKGDKIALTYLNNRINVKWTLTESKRTAWSRVGSYYASVPVPPGLKLTGHILASDALDVQTTLEKIIQAAQ